MVNDGITIRFRNPLATGLADMPEFSETSPQSYSHTIAALGGYKTATIGLVGAQVDIEDWLEYGLARDITVYNEAQEVIWNGFVDSISAVVGGRTVDRGPVMEIINRLSVQYSPIDMSVNPPIVGGKTLTPAANDLTSQARYGILEDVLSAGECTDADALIIRDTYLEESKDPGTKETLSTEGGTPSVTLNCAGYAEYLGRYMYTSTAVTTSTVTEKIQDILAADPNSVVSTDYTNITANALPVSDFEERERTGWDTLLAEVAKGDATGSRYTFGIYAERKAYYGPIPTGIDYRVRLADGSIETSDGLYCYPWDIMPARWLLYSDFMVGRSVPNTNLRTDPRVMFVEGVTYTAPMGISLEGGKISRLSQIMARLGLGGSA